jgi:AmmeMemoRadiSam system protein B/AmmeMemoRadiSam system protein A
MRVLSEGHAMSRSCQTSTVSVLGGLLVLLLASCSVGPPPASAEDKSPPPSAGGESRSEAEPEPETFKDMAVAGLFFPGDADALRKEIEGHLQQAQPEVKGRVRALICPHAGYQYSGSVAAYGFKLLQGQDIRTVVLLAPSHYARFDGAALPEVDAFRTPLGITRLSPLVKQLASRPPFAVSPEAKVSTPGWAAQSPVRPRGAETPHTWEHSEEVMIPFLQSVLKDFRLVPAVLGRVDEAELAGAILPHLNAQTLVLASSDLSHYHPYEDAQKLDRACVEAICAMDFAAMAKQEACGKGPILTLMHLAKARRWTPVLLDLRNSGDTSGEKARGVVGYAAIAFVQEGKEDAQPQGRFTPDERTGLLKMARLSLTAEILDEKPPVIEAQTLPAKFREPKGCFVTLTLGGELRGCIGHIFPTEPLYKAILENAIHAGTRDPRFPRVTEDELKQLHFEISVLTVPQELTFDSPADLLVKLRPHVDGVVLRIGHRSSTYLPQVWEHFKKKEDFLNHLSRKAGLPEDAWRGTGVTVLTYQAEAFEEQDRVRE